MKAYLRAKLILFKKLPKKKLYNYQMKFIKNLKFFKSISKKRNLNLKDIKKFNN